jgi:hypothetical protein
VVNWASILTLALLTTPCPQDPAGLSIISRREGFYKPHTLPARLHNPGALKFIGQTGARRGKLGFAQFEKDEDGWRALEVDFEVKLQKGTSPRRAWKYVLH